MVLSNPFTASICDECDVDGKFSIHIQSISRLRAEFSSSDLAHLILHLRFPFHHLFFLPISSSFIFRAMKLLTTSTTCMESPIGSEICAEPKIISSQKPSNFQLIIYQWTKNSENWNLFPPRHSRRCWGIELECCWCYCLKLFSFNKIFTRRWRRLLSDERKEKINIHLFRLSQSLLRLLTVCANEERYDYNADTFFSQPL